MKDLPRSSPCRVHVETKALCLGAALVVLLGHLPVAGQEAPGVDGDAEKLEALLVAAESGAGFGATTLVTDVLRAGKVWMRPVLEALLTSVESPEGIYTSQRTGVYSLVLQLCGEDRVEETLIGMDGPYFGRVGEHILLSLLRGAVFGHFDREEAMRRLEERVHSLLADRTAWIGELRADGSDLLTRVLSYRDGLHERLLMWSAGRALACAGRGDASLASRIRTEAQRSDGPCVVRMPFLIAVGGLREKVDLAVLRAAIIEVQQPTQPMFARWAWACGTALREWGGEKAVEQTVEWLGSSCPALGGPFALEVGGDTGLAALLDRVTRFPDRLWLPWSGFDPPPSTLALVKALDFFSRSL